MAFFNQSLYKKNGMSIYLENVTGSITCGQCLCSRLGGKMQQVKMKDEFNEIALFVGELLL